MQLNIKEVINKLKEKKAFPIEIYNKYAVLIPLIEINDELHLIYQVRSFDIKRQPGEISFPGGQLENNENFKEAAIRETCEELGVKESHIEIISDLDYIIGNGMIIYPYVGYLKNIEFYKLNFSKEEVHELFIVPLDYLIKNEPQKYDIEYKPAFNVDFPFNLIQNRENYKWDKIKKSIYFYKYDHHIIWGLTAKITYYFIKKLMDKKNNNTY